MSVRVNLLPEAAKVKARAGRQKTGLTIVGLLLVAALGAAYWWAAGQVTKAEAELAAEETRTGELRAEVNALGDIQELQLRQQEAETLLVEALASEVSFADVLQDVASVIPSDTQLESLAVTLGESEPSDPSEGRTIGTFNATGKTLTAHAPGVERFLLELGKVVSFKDLYLNSSTLDDPEERVATFSVDGQLGPESLTTRYLTGLPEELR